MAADFCHEFDLWKTAAKEECSGWLIRIMSALRFDCPFWSGSEHGSYGKQECCLVYNDLLESPPVSFLPKEYENDESLLLALKNTLEGFFAIQKSILAKDTMWPAECKKAFGLAECLPHRLTDSDPVCKEVCERWDKAVSVLLGCSATDV